MQGIAAPGAVLPGPWGDGRGCRELTRNPDPAVEDWAFRNGLMQFRCSAARPTQTHLAAVLFDDADWVCVPNRTQHASRDRPIPRTPAQGPKSVYSRSTERNRYSRPFRLDGRDRIRIMFSTAEWAKARQGIEQGAGVVRPQRELRAAVWWLWRGRRELAGRHALPAGGKRYGSFRPRH